MKRTKNRRRRRCVLNLFVLSLCFTVLFTSGSAGLKEATATDRTTGKQLTPVLRSEKWLTTQINEKRQMSGSTSLKPDWDLFRFSRTYAKDLAAGKIQKVDIHETEQMLRDLGRIPTHMGCLIVRTSVNHSFPESWWQSSQWKMLAGETNISRIGTGHASRENEQVWVILFTKV